MMMWRARGALALVARRAKTTGFVGLFRSAQRRNPSGAVASLEWKIEMDGKIPFNGGFAGEKRFLYVYSI